MRLQQTAQPVVTNHLFAVRSLRSLADGLRLGGFLLLHFLLLLILILLLLFSLLLLFLLLALLLSLLLDQTDRKNDVEGREDERDEKERDNLEITNQSGHSRAWGKGATSPLQQSQTSSQA